MSGPPAQLKDIPHLTLCSHSRQPETLLPSFRQSSPDVMSRVQTGSEGAARSNFHPMVSRTLRSYTAHDGPAFAHRDGATLYKVLPEGEKDTDDDDDDEDGTGTPWSLNTADDETRKDHEGLLHGEHSSSFKSVPWGARAAKRRSSAFSKLLRGNKKRRGRRSLIFKAVVAASAVCACCLLGLIMFTSRDGANWRTVGGQRGDAAAVGDVDAAARFSLPGGYVRHHELEETARTTVFLFKTGYTVMFDRLPVQIMHSPPMPSSPLRKYYSDVEFTLDDVYVKNILQDISPRLQALPVFKTYYRLHSLIASGLPVPHGGEFWDLDALKIMPIHGDAYRAHRDFNWHVAADGDTFLFTENILRYLSAHDAAQLHYLGHRDSREINCSTARLFGDGKLFWAHGGSGYALSKGLLDHMLQDDPFRFNGGIDQTIAEEGAGDVILGRVIMDLTNGTIKGPNAGEHLFNPDPVRSLNFVQENWYLPVLSLHHLSNAEIYGLRLFEQDALNLLQRIFGPKGDMIRRCDIAHYILPSDLKGALEQYTRRPSASQHTLRLEHHRFAISHPVSFGPDWGKYLKKAYNPDLCIGLCEEVSDCPRNPLQDDVHPGARSLLLLNLCFIRTSQRKECFGWQWEKDKGCALQLDSWNLPLPVPEDSIESGIRIDRIAAFMAKNDCYDMRKRTFNDTLWMQRPSLLP
ncbi:glycosyltransferase family 31 protein [Tilletiaria anomala UBC 951]|uniref:N-acetylgalactosaminide beta-1,3-galactosyltransferase n=1 Tax=Tilletiaria anomala (strain ATCC 24038 / CBS 436.72 / UBC 951) TaxID=1037660 RepID=A0A066VRC3_TILAU|nr:glycosyltransferase family 31 protein [Tilletiaria anomala UBC 951]KDN41140.1 glycosyltransferase family 31 protein [Tilletiaria anomala UBC 951]